jgi:hypothetical protein
MAGTIYQRKVAKLTIQTESRRESKTAAAAQVELDERDIPPSSQRYKQSRTFDVMCNASLVPENTAKNAMERNHKQNARRKASQKANSFCKIGFSEQSSIKFLLIIGINFTH